MSSTEPAFSWKTRTYFCTVTERKWSEIWDPEGVIPWIPGNVYLRESALLEDWTPTTVAAKAARLLHLAKWLDACSVDFWSEELRLGGAAMARFRKHLLDQSMAADGGTARPLSLETIKAILREVHTLCRYWQCQGERIHGELGSGPRGSRRSGRQRLPPAFRLKTHGSSKRGEQSLTLAEVERVWRFLWRDSRPARRPPSSIHKEQWQIDMAFWSRDCLLWALLISTGIRRGELPLLMLQDVVHDPKTGWWINLIDPRDSGWKGGSRPAPGSFGGRPKTGSRTLIIWFQDWFDQAFRQWIQWRPILVAKTGEPDHGMLLVANKGRGGGAGYPFGYRSVDSFFTKVNESLGPFRGDSSAFSFLLSSHRVRHSLESILKNAGVALVFRQATLGHSRGETTEAYGTLFRAQAIAAQARLRSILEGDEADG